MLMPFWNAELYVEISQWFPIGKDYQPISVNRFYDSDLQKISASCMDLGSEFFFMASPSTGCVGNLPRENFFKYNPDSAVNLGFLMILGYSDKIERGITASLAMLESARGLFAGITSCSLWSHGIFQGNTKVIAITSDDPFYNCNDYIRGLARILDEVKKFLGSGNDSYFAEKFGYDRFFMQWEDDNPFDLRVSQILNEFELDSTREIVGDRSNMDFPPFIGAVMRTQE
ncbi:MAG: hypothetical protein IJT21_00965 [Synergistaceae bacterium]|nr:hypothetical protein [Synergistaceae bacterium]